MGGLRMRLLSKVVLVIASLGCATAAVAQPRIPGGNIGGQAPAPSGGGLLIKLTPEQVVGLLNEAGFHSEVRRDSVDAKVVVAAFWGQEPYSGVIMDHCEKDGSGCHNLFFFANYGKDQPVDANWINAWNNSKIGVKALKLDDGTLLFEYDLSLLTGVTADYVKEFAKFFKLVVDTATQFKP
jgi:Putative bacterial sensory transduction regulator